MLRQQSYGLKLGMRTIFGMVLLFVFGGVVYAETDVEVQPVGDINQIADESLTAEDILNKLNDIKEMTLSSAQFSQSMTVELRKMRQQARQNDPAVAEIQEQIAALKKSIEKVIDEIPQIKEKADELAQSKQRMFQLMQERVQYQGLLSKAKRKEQTTNNQEPRTKNQEQINK